MGMLDGVNPALKVSLPMAIFLKTRWLYVNDLTGHRSDSMYAVLRAALVLPRNY